MAQLLQNAAYGTALILAAALLRQTLKGRLLPGARLILWALCLFRLLTPVPLESALSLWGLFQPQTPAAAPTPAPIPTPQLYTPAFTSPAPAAQSALAISWETVLLAAWLLVGLALAVRYVLSWTRTRRAVLCTIPVERGDPRYAPLPKYARLREGPMEGAPLTFGAVTPTVVLIPGLEGETLECVLAHEGVHARRRDNLWHYAMALALVIHWWNPAVWLMARLLRRDIELSCDRAAVNKLGAERRADYANALLSLATQAKSPAFCQTFGRKAAEERILSVMKFKKASVIGVILSLALVLAVTAAFASSPKEPQDSYGSEKVNSVTNVTGQLDLDEILAYVQDLTLDMSREDVHKVLGEPSFSMSSPTFFDCYELDPNTPEPQLGIYYDMDATVIQVRYFPNGTDPDASSIDLANYLSDAGEAQPSYGLDDDIIDPRYAPRFVTLDEYKILLDGLVADGKMTQEDADWLYAGAEKDLAQYGDGTPGIIMTNESGGYAIMPANWDQPTYVLDATQTTYPVNSKGKTYGELPATYMSTFDAPDLVFVSARAETDWIDGYIPYARLYHPSYPGPFGDSYSDEFATYTEWLKTQPDVLTQPLYDCEENIIGEFRSPNPEKLPAVNDYDVKLPTFDEDSDSSISSDLRNAMEAQWKARLQDQVADWLATQAD